MPDRAWKRVERAIAARLGGRRMPITGRQRGDAPDIAHPLFAVEVKSRATLPTWLHKAMAQAIAAQRDGQLPVVILHESHTHHAEDFVCLRLADFMDWFGALDAPGGTA